MRIGELGGRAFDVRTDVLELVVDTLLQCELTEIDLVVRVRGHFFVRVLLPCVGFGTADDDFESVVLQRAGPVFGLALLTSSAQPPSSPTRTLTPSPSSTVLEWHS